jgi:hypothetical protein
MDNGGALDDKQYLTFSDCSMLEKCITRSRIVLQNRLTLDVYGGDEQGRVRICGMNSDKCTAIDLVFFASHFHEFEASRDYSLSLHANDVLKHALKGCGQNEPLRLKWSKEEPATLMFIRPPQWTSSIVQEPSAVVTTDNELDEQVDKDVLGGTDEERFVFGHNNNDQQMGSSALANIMFGSKPAENNRPAPKRLPKQPAAKKGSSSNNNNSNGDTNISSAKRRKNADTEPLAAPNMNWTNDAENCQITQLPLFIYTKESEFGHFDPAEHGCPLVCEWDVDMAKMKPILAEMMSMATASSGDKSVKICLIMLPTNTLHFVVETMTVSKRFPIPTNIIKQYTSIPSTSATNNNRKSTSIPCMWMCLVTLLQLNAINAFASAALLSVSMYAQAASLEEMPPGYILSANFRDLSAGTSGKYREDLQSNLTLGVFAHGADDVDAVENRFKLPKEWNNLFKS